MSWCTRSSTPRNRAPSPLYIKQHSCTVCASYLYRTRHDTIVDMIYQIRQSSPHKVLDTARIVYVSKWCMWALHTRDTWDTREIRGITFITNILRTFFQQKKTKTKRQQQPCFIFIFLQIASDQPYPTVTTYRRIGLIVSVLHQF